MIVLDDYIIGELAFINDFTSNSVNFKANCLFEMYSVFPTVGTLTLEKITPMEYAKHTKLLGPKSRTWNLSPNKNKFKNIRKCYSNEKVQ